MTSEGRIASRNVEPDIDNSMRAKQLVASLRQGRKIVVQILDEDHPIVGYLAGWDSDTYLLLEPVVTEGTNNWKGRVEEFEEYSFNKFLVPKGHILFIGLRDERTFREEAMYEEMEQIVKPFREVINKQYAK